MSTHTELASSESISARSSDWRQLYGIGAASALVLLVYSLATMLILILVGAQPETASEGFAMLQKNRITGLLRLDILSIVIMPLYYVIFLAIYSAVRKAHDAYAMIATLLVFAGLTLFLATPSALSWMALSDKYAAATSAEQKALLLAAGESILASDMWHGSGPVMGGILLQTGALVVSFAMLAGRSFAKATAYVGIVTHGLDLLHIFVAFALPVGGVILMAIAGPLYLVWCPLVARDLYRLRRN